MTPRSAPDHDHDDPSRRRARSSALTIALTGIAVAVLYVVSDRVIEDVLEIESGWGQLGEVAVMAFATSMVLWLGVLRPLHHRIADETRAADRQRRELTRAAEIQQFEGQLHRALEMAPTEDVVYRITHKALEAAAPDIAAELLLADSSDAHLKSAVSTNADDGTHCPVVAPHDCPALRRAQTLVFDSSEELDACPQLGGRSLGACSATCVPMSVGGRAIGVLHTVSTEHAPPREDTLRRIEAVANQTGSKIGMLRVMASTTLQAATDPLTGLLNRRAFEDRVHGWIRSRTPFALAMGDLDHFKRVNDTHGHDAGDRALRLFSRVMTSRLRADDLVSRYGGEEFIVAFPDRSAEQAADSLRRVQEELLVALGSGTVPGFTVSFGVAHSDAATGFEELCRIADHALYQAKSQGRDRVIVEATLGAVGHPDGPPLTTPDTAGLPPDRN